MSRSLFIGCSHTMGYLDPNPNSDAPPQPWQDNNYAEFYAKQNNKPVVIMASAGAGNSLWPRFLAYAFQKYNDIDEVFVQSTYWGRFAIAMNPNLDAYNILPIDYFIEKEKSDDLIERYSLGLYQDKFVEYYLKPESYDYDELPYNRYTAPFCAEPDVRRSSHMYIRMWHYSNTHLDQYDYFKDVLVCDALCLYNSVKMHLWNINDRCFIPKETNNWLTKLQATNIANIDAISYLKKYNENIKLADTEHYSKETHEIIAKEYIPYIKDTK